MNTQALISRPMIQPLKLSLKNQNSLKTMRKAKEYFDESKLIFNLDAFKTVRFPTRNAKNNYSINLNNEDIEQNSVSKYLALYTKIGNNELIKLMF